MSDNASDTSYEPLEPLLLNPGGGSTRWGEQVGARISEAPAQNLTGSASLLATIALAHAN